MPFGANDAFCAQADVEERMGRAAGAFDAGTSKPSKQQVLDFMGQRALEIQAAMFAAGHRYTVPSGSTPLPATTDQDKAIKQLAINANAWFAAGDTFMAHEVRESGDEPTTEAKAAWAQGKDILAKLIAAIGSIVQGGSARSSTTTGGVARADFTEVPYDKQRPRSSAFGRDTKW